MGVLWGCAVIDLTLDPPPEQMTSDGVAYGSGDVRGKCGAGLGRVSEKLWNGSSVGDG